MRRSAVTDRPVHRAAAVWWQSPVTVLVLVVPAAVVPTFLLDDADFLLLWRTPRALTPDMLLLLLAGGLTVALAAATVLAVPGAARPAAGPWLATSRRQIAILERWSTAMLALTVLGYAAYLVTAVRAGVGLGDVVAVLGEGGLYTGTLKEVVRPVTGVTTLTQFGIASAVLSAVLFVRTRARRHLAAMLLVVTLALPRAVLLTERLSILELVVPVIVVLTAGAASRRGRLLVAAVPLLAVPVVATLFAVFEYSRSWVWFREHSDWSFVEFVGLRLAGYYVTALNNGALQLLHNDGPHRWPHETVSGLWTAPGVEDWDVYGRLSGRSQDQRYLEILQTHGWEEFNNSSGLAAPFVDYGVGGGLVLMAVAGAVLGLLYRSFLAGRGLGLLLYPVLFLGVVELPRLLAWPAGRLLPALAVLAVIAWHLGRTAPEAAADRRPEPPVGPFRTGHTALRRREHRQHEGGEAVAGGRTRSTCDGRNGLLRPLRPRPENGTAPAAERPSAHFPTGAAREPGHGAANG